MFATAIKNLLITIQSLYYSWRYELVGWRYPLTNRCTSTASFTTNHRMAEHVVFNALKCKPIADLCDILDYPLVLRVAVCDDLLVTTAFRLIDSQTSQTSVCATNAETRHGIFTFLVVEGRLYRCNRMQALDVENGYMPEEPVFCNEAVLDHGLHKYLTELAD